MLRTRLTFIVLGVFVLFLGAAAFGISKAQEQSRRGLVSRFNDRAGFGSLFLGTLLDLSAQARVKQATSELAGPNPDQQTLRKFVNKAAPQQPPFARLLDSRGRVLAAIPVKAGADPKLLAHNLDLSIALRKGTPYTGNIIATPAGGQVVEVAVPFETPHGRRVIAMGGTVAVFDSFMKSFLKGIPAVQGGRAYLLDANSRVLASSKVDPLGARLGDSALISALSRQDSGSYEANGKLRFVRRQMPASSLSFVLAVPESRLFSAIDSAATLVWALYGAFAAALVAGLLLLLRVQRRSRQLALAEQQRAAAIELAREQKRADAEAERLKSEFFGIVSHELRTPLTSIMGYVDLLKERDHDQLSEEGQGRLDVVHRNAGRLDRLVQDLLMLTQLEAGTFSIDPGEVDICHLARNLEPEASLMAELAEVEFSIACGGVPIFGGDPSRLVQVLDNLISNAIKFTPKGGRVAVKIAPDGDRCMFEVSDTGVGVEAKDLGQLFNRFYRGDTVPPGKVPGAGLGLAIVEAIVEAHGGEVTVESEPGQGSTFRVFIPMTPVPSGQPRRALGRGRVRRRPAVGDMIR